MRLQRAVRDSDEDEADPIEDDAPIKLAWRRVDAEDQILAVLDAPRTVGEQYDVTFRRKEHQLGEIFAGLSAIDSIELQRRLNLRLADDVLAARFGRLTSDRRARLIAFLVAMRRRFAVVSREGRRE
jgi:hypothetical protein